MAYVCLDIYVCVRADGWCGYVFAERKTKTTNSNQNTRAWKRETIDQRLNINGAREIPVNWASTKN